MENEILRKESLKHLILRISLERSKAFCYIFPCLRTSTLQSLSFNVLLYWFFFSLSLLLLRISVPIRIEFECCDSKFDSIANSKNRFVDWNRIWHANSFANCNVKSNYSHMLHGQQQIRSMNRKWWQRHQIDLLGLGKHSAQND